MSDDLLDSHCENGDLESDEHSHLVKLMSSVRLGDVDGATALLDEVDINGRNEDGYSVLHAAVYSGNLSLIRTLIDRGADVNHQSQQGLTPLHIAVQENLPQVVQLLVVSGADKNLADQQGNSPLGQAMQLVRVYLDIMEVLTKKNCTQMNSVDDKGPCSPMLVGRRSGLLGRMPPIKESNPDEDKTSPKVVKDEPDKPEYPVLLSQENKDYDKESESNFQPSRKSLLTQNQDYFDFGRLMLKDHSSVLSDTRKSDEELASSNISGASGNNVEILLSEIRPASLIPMPESPADPSENSTSGMKMPVDDPRAEETGTKTKSNMTSSTESEDEEDVYQCLVRPIGNDYSRLNRFSNKKDSVHSDVDPYERIARLGSHEHSTSKLSAGEDEKKYDESEYISKTGFKVVLRNFSESDKIDKINPIVCDKPLDRSAVNGNGHNLKLVTIFQRESTETEDKSSGDDLEVDEITEDCLPSELIDLVLYEKLVQRDPDDGEHYVKIIKLGAKDGDKPNIRVVDRLKNKLMLFKIAETTVPDQCQELVKRDKNLRRRSSKPKKFHNEDEIRKLKTLKAIENRGKKSAKEKALLNSDGNALTSVNRLCYLDDDDWDHYSKPRKHGQRKSTKKFWTCRKLFRSNSRH